MRLNPQPSRFRVSHSELYEASVRKLAQTYPFVDEALESLEWSLRRIPFSEGELCAAFPGRELRFTVLPRTNRYPSLRVLFEVIDPTVYCWHACEAP